VSLTKASTSPRVPDDSEFLPRYPDVEGVSASFCSCSSSERHFLPVTRRAAWASEGLAQSLVKQRIPQLLRDVQASTDECLDQPHIPTSLDPRTTTQDRPRRAGSFIPWDRRVAMRSFEHAK
jgi:hypothetical protein